VDCRAATVDVLAGVLGTDKGLRVTELALLLTEAVGEQHRAIVAADPTGESLRPTLESTLVAVYELGWARLDGPVVREAVRCLALLAHRPVPRVLITDLSGGFASAVEDALWAGFASLDEKEDRLVLAPNLRSFVLSRAESEEDARGRPCRILEALRRGLAHCDVEDERYDQAAESGLQLATALDEYGTAAMIAHRMSERLRRRGWSGAARRWSARLVELVEAGHPEVQALRGPSLLDRGLLELEAGRHGLARDLLTEASLEFEHTEEAGQEGAHPFFGQTQLVLSEVLFELGDLRAADAALRLSMSALEQSKAVLEESEAIQSAEERTGTVLRRARIAALELSLVQALRLSACQQLAKGDSAAALAGLREARRRWCDLEGDQQPEGACFHLSLAGALRSGGEDPEQDEALDAARVLLGGDMDRVVQRGLPVALHDQAVLAGDRGEFEHAETLLVEAAMVAGGLVSESDPIHADILYTRGLGFLARGETEQADACFAEGESAAVRAPGTSRSPQLNIQAARAWAWSLRGEDHYDEAVRALEVVERVMLQERGPEDTFVAHIKLLRRSLQS